MKALPFPRLYKCYDVKDSNRIWTSMKSVAFLDYCIHSPGYDVMPVMPLSCSIPVISNDN